jgi:hypothetical protein
MSAIVLNRSSFGFKKARKTFNRGLAVAGLTAALSLGVFPTQKAEAACGFWQSVTATSMYATGCSWATGGQCLYSTPVFFTIHYIFWNACPAGGADTPGGNGGGSW